MKTILLTIALCFSTYLIHAQSLDNTDIGGTTITVTVPVQSDQGSVLFALHNESTFMKKPLVGLKSEIKDGKAEVVFTGVQPGVYGITVLHDKNNNELMDFDEYGRPMEPYGVSNNVMTYGPPMWSDAKFEIGAEPIIMEIRL